jgi:hypothetical protein
MNVKNLRDLRELHVGDEERRTILNHLFDSDVWYLASYVKAGKLSIWTGVLTDVVLQFSHGLFQWQAPSLPEDLALLRKPGDVWLGSVAHEGDAWLELTEAEHSGLVASIPDIGALLAKPRRTGTEVPSDDPT